MDPLTTGALISGGISLLGGERGNMRRAAEAQKDRDFQSTEAATSRDFTSAQSKRQMDFQERMRSTEWQVGVEDMKKAGLNPALAYSQGGASSPGGAAGAGAAGSGSQARQEDTITPAISSAMQYRRLSAELKNMQATRENVQMDTSIKAGNWRRLLGGSVSSIVSDPLGSLKKYFSGYNRAGNIVGSSARSIKDAMGKGVGLLRGKRSIKETPAWQLFYGPDGRIR